MRSLYDIGFDDGMGGTSPVTNDLDRAELALYMLGYDEGDRVRTLLEEN